MPPPPYQVSRVILFALLLLPPPFCGLRLAAQLAATAAGQTEGVHIRSHAPPPPHPPPLLSETASRVLQED
jgi:hypothetical protein